MNKLFYTASMLVLLILHSSCTKLLVGKGSVVKKELAMGDFSAIQLDVEANVVYQQSSVSKVELSAQQNILDELEVENNNGKLRIKLKHFGLILKGEPIQIVLNSSSLKSCEVSGSGHINTAGPVSADNFDAEISGSGSIQINQLQCTTLDACISGSGTIEVFDGSCNHIHSDISGSGDFLSTGFAAKSAEAETSGSGTHKLKVSDLLDVRITGSGDVYYLGEPVVNTHITGSGKVIKL